MLVSVPSNTTTIRDLAHLEILESPSGWVVQTCWQDFHFTSQVDAITFHLDLFMEANWGGESHSPGGGMGFPRGGYGIPHFGSKWGMAFPRGGEWDSPHNKGLAIKVPACNKWFANRIHASWQGSPGGYATRTIGSLPNGVGSTCQGSSCRGGYATTTLTSKLRFTSLMSKEGEL